MTTLVSVIMPAYNAAEYIEEAISSVVHQSHENWELIIINDGSTDQTSTIAERFDDKRISIYSQENGGVGRARNFGLQKMRGEYFCFLDADDILPENAIKSRLAVFNTNPEIAFVSGKVVQMDKTLSRTLSTQVPTFRGRPQREIIRLSSACLVAITWLIKRVEGRSYRFPEGWTHSEDVAFFLSISEDGLYDFTSDEVLIYRRNEQSAMGNLDGLYHSYIKYYKLVVNTITNLKEEDRKYLKNRIRRIMVLSYLRNKNLIKAIKAFFELSRL